ncbi:SNF2 family N-terminal domain-containing protein [Nemania abortiva]|nr:SNF2 family N-terminal domain-containing protein [Nemania abortiva]
MDLDRDSRRPLKRSRLDLPPTSWASSTREQSNFTIAQYPPAGTDPDYDPLPLSLPYNNSHKQALQHHFTNIHSTSALPVPFPGNAQWESGDNQTGRPLDPCGPVFNQIPVTHLRQQPVLSQTVSFNYPQPTPPWLVNDPTPPLPQPWNPHHVGPSLQAEFSSYEFKMYPKSSEIVSQEHSSFQPHLGVFPQAHSTIISPQDVINNEARLTFDANFQPKAPLGLFVDQSETVCLGMVPHISGTYEQIGTCELPPEFPAHFDSSERFSTKDNRDMKGRIHSTHSQMIQGLLDEQTLDLHVDCILDMQLTKRKPLQNSFLLPCTLEITVYGPLELYGEIGSWFQEYEIYLQDPRICHLDVRYCNPQRLSSYNFEFCPLVSEVVKLASSLIPLQHIAEQTDMLQILSNSVDLEETPQPEAIRATLKRHQKQALTFMLRRERGWVFTRGCKDIWETVDNDYGRVFVNTIANNWQAEEPPQFRGGIIADPMGLGKTLTMIALSATDLETRYGSRELNNKEGDGRFSTPATLVIVPPPLIGTWEEQLAEHVAKDCLKFCRHHGKTRLANAAGLQSMNVVLTTYHTVSAEWQANESERNSSILFAVRWRRVILDEAHFIRNGNSRMSHAVCALESNSRWAVTGTPIQNRLADLATLLKFIRVYPYNDPRRFEADISNLWKSGAEEEAVRRLKNLSAFLLLRRPKGTIDLPLRQDLLLPVEFNREERKIYNTMRDQVITKIDEALHDTSGASRAGLYYNTLQQIESLRLFSNLGLQYHSRHNKDKGMPEEWIKMAQRTFDSQRVITPILCMQCSSAVELTEAWINESNIPSQSPRFFQCSKFVCGDCMDKLTRRGRSVSCGHVPSCSVALVSTGSSTLEETPDLVVTGMGTPLASLPSKIKALVMDLKTVPTDIKCVVFSTWRLTLDLVQAGLRDAGIYSTRFDGKVPQKDRQSVITDFRTNPRIRVMLLTLSCGAVGLTLTAASRAYLMEPHWNPTVEEQALARVHRLGQTKEVTTIRLYIRDSFEEQVMQVQESKKQLAGMLLSPHDGKNMDLSLSALEKLRALL